VTITASATTNRTTDHERFRQYRASRDRRIRNRLIEDHRWLAVHCARRFAGKGEPLDDLIQVAMLGVLKAIERFDPTYGVVFSTFGIPTVVGELRRHFRDKSWTLHVPRRTKELYQAVHGVIDELYQTLGRSPTVPEIGERVGISEEDVLIALEVGDSYRGVPLSPPGDDDASDATTLGNDDPGYAAAEARMMVKLLVRTLPTHRERVIVKLRFIDNLTQTEIAQQIGVSQVQISRILRTSLLRMRRRAGSLEAR
jgi:RNA polymerase sigma-B factor